MLGAYSCLPQEGARAPRHGSRKVKAGWEHTDDGVFASIERQRLPDDS
jgi:hypothetical protein